jgi:hypothetical protein
MGALRNRKRQIEILNDKTGRQLLEYTREAFRLAMKEEKGRDLTPEEEDKILDGIEIVDIEKSPEEYEFDRVSDLVSQGISLREAEEIVRQEVKTIYED